MTKEELKALQDQTPTEYKYFFDFDSRMNDYEWYVKDGKPDLNKIQTEHQHVIKCKGDPFEDFSFYDVMLNFDSFQLYIRYLNSKK